MADIRDTIESGPISISFDIDSLDPAFAPATGTVEPDGLTTWQALEIPPGTAGLNAVGVILSKSRYPATVQATRP